MEVFQLRIHTDLAWSKKARDIKTIKSVKRCFEQFLDNKGPTNGIILPSDMDEHGRYLVQLITTPQISRFPTLYSLAE